MRSETGLELHEKSALSDFRVFQQNRPKAAAHRIKTLQV